MTCADVPPAPSGSRSASSASSPRVNLAPPTPPESTVTFTRNLRDLVRAAAPGGSVATPHRRDATLRRRRPAPELYRTTAAVDAETFETVV
ncbi:hypothetical protein CCO02nite_03520 [Cellulomonas composti]|uniref:Uncharacterized protein n=1 Tax=Cellulomonas composti TaxID=266130 RepID=A0A511J6T5_9CELL|nr:hypothetical protein CCO02nite_03520 [Cellulomonas composti]